MSGSFNRIQFVCQNCSEQYEKIKDYKFHVRSFCHKKVVAKLFQTAVHKGPVFFPMFVVLDYQKCLPQNLPLIGLDLVTLCITPEKLGAFYLCHVCEMQLSSCDIIGHLSSAQHYSKYLAHSNPELLYFGWHRGDFSYLQSSALKAKSINGSGKLRIFEIPNMMLMNGKTMTYNQVMSMFSKIDAVTDRMRVGTPKRKTIQQYIADPSRTHPLLGINSLLEFFCLERDGCYGYLCTLCEIKLSAIDIISHCIQFEHVESSLGASLKCTGKCSTYCSDSFHKELVHAANRAQEQSPPGEIESVHLDFKNFKKVFSSKFTNSLRKLQQMIKESNKAEVKVAVTPGEQGLVAPEAAVLSESTPTPIVATVEQKLKVSDKTQDVLPLKTANQPCKIRCLECDEMFIRISDYKEHVNENKHQQKLVDLFGPGMFSGFISDIKLYKYMFSHQNKPSPSPLIGLSLLTVFVHRQSRGFTSAMYMCHACELTIPVSSACTHLWSTQHHYHVFAYKRPDYVFLGSRNLNQITEFAKKEEKLENNLVLQVCDLPTGHFDIFRTLPYDKVMARIRKLKLSKYIQVEERVTLQAFSKSCDRQSPVVGLQFMVKYTLKVPHSKCGYLCLLCEKMLPERHAIVHILSTSHVVAYLNMAHPDSLSREEAEEMSLVTDLAQQAEKLNPNVDIQEVELGFDKFHTLEVAGYHNAKAILQWALNEKGLGELKPNVVPGAKLFPSMNTCQVNSQCETQDGSQSSADSMQNLETTCSETLIPTLPDMDCPETCSETKCSEMVMPETACQENGSQCIIQGSNSTIFVSEQVSSDEKCSEMDDHNAMDMDIDVDIDIDVSPGLTHTKQMDKLDAAVSPDIHQISLTMQSSQLATPLLLNQQSGTQDFIPEPESNPAVLQANIVETISTYEKPQCTQPILKPTTTVDDLSTLTQSAPEIPTETLAAVCSGVSSTEEGEAHKGTAINVTYSESTKLQCYLSKIKRKPVIGLKSVIECHTDNQPPFYMCLTCADRFDQNSIVKHLTGHDHQHMYLKSIKHIYLQHKKKVSPNWLRAQAIFVERAQGSGEAEVLELDPKEYHVILKCPIITALGRLRECLLKLTSDVNAQSPVATCSVEMKEPETHKRPTEEMDSAQGTVISSDPDTSLKQGMQRVYRVSSSSGTADPAQSSPYLWSCLNSSSRTEPVIGLSVITEYRNSTGQNSFLCSSCEVILSTSNYMSHLVSPEHRFNYIKNKHPALVALWSDEINVACKSTELMVKAQMLQDIEGWGCLKVVEKETPKNKQGPSENDENSSKLHTQEPSQTSVTNVSTEQQYHNHKKLNPAKDKTNKKKNTILIGLNFVTCVSHGEKKLFFCELCSVRCHLDHMTSEAHRKMYLESIYPSYHYPSDANMKMMLYKRLATVEKITGMRMKKLNVTAKVFTALRTAPFCDALSELKSLKAQLEAGVDLKAITVSPQRNPDAVSDHQNANNGISNDVEEEMLEAAVTASTPKQEQSLTLERPLVSDDLSTTNPCSSPPNDSFSHSSFSLSCFPVVSPVSKMNSSPNNFSSPVISSSELQPPPRPYSPISPPPPFLYSSVSVPLPSPVPCSPVESTKPEDEPISPIPDSAHQNSPSIGILSSSPPGSSSPPAAVELNYRMESKKTLDVSMLKGEKMTVDTIPPPQTFSLPRLPPVMGQSHACVFLNVRGLLSTEPIIGLSNILECRRISQPTFFLCLNCAETVSREGICDHMTSEQHQYFSIRYQYPKIYQDWKMQTIHNITIRDLAWEVASQEKLLDAKVIKLDQIQYETLRSASFQHAIDLLQMMYGPEQNENSPTHITNRESTSRDIDVASVKDQQTNICRPTREELQSPRSPKAFPDNSVQTIYSHHESTSQIDLRIKSDFRNTVLQSSKPHTGRTQESPGLTESPGLHQGPSAHSLPSNITIKQEKPDDYDVVVIVPTVDTPSPVGATGNSLKHTTDLMEFLNIRKDAADAVVGLNTVIECISEGQVPLYFCISCSSRLNQDLIISHLLKCGHRYNYLRARYPSMIEDWSDSDSRSQRSTKLMWLAHKVESSFYDEPGQLQKVTLNCVDFKKIKSLPFDKAIMKLQKLAMLQKLGPLRTNIVPKITTVLVKQERMEMEVTTQDFSHLVDSSECNSQKPKKALKRRVVEQDLSDQSSCNNSSSHQKGLLQNNFKPFESSVKRRKKSSDHDLSTPSTLYSHNPGTSAKGSEVHQCPSREKSSNNPSSLLKLSPLKENSLEPCKSQMEKIFDVKKGSVGNCGKWSKRLSVDSDASLASCSTTCIVPETLLTTSAGSQNPTMTQNCSESLKNSDVQKTPTPLDKNLGGETGMIPVLPSMEGEKIARLSEKRPLVKMRSSEKWNYENRQFCLEPLNEIKSISVADVSSIASAHGGQYMSTELYNNELNPHYEWKNHTSDFDSGAVKGCNSSLSVEDATNVSQPMYFAVSTGHSTASVTSNVIPEYAIPYQYSVIKQSDYSPSVGVLVPSYAANLDVQAEGAISMQDTPLSSLAYASQTLYQSQNVYPPVQFIQNPEAYHAFYAYSPYNQSLQLDQTASISGSDTCTTSTYGHSDGLHPLLKWKQGHNEK